LSFEPQGKEEAATNLSRGLGRPGEASRVVGCCGALAKATLREDRAGARETAKPPFIEPKLAL